MVGVMISGIVFGLCAAVMIGIGIAQMKSAEPVGFYSGGEAPKAAEITDVAAWNRKHGAMWILYGIGLVLAWVCGLIVGESLWVLAPLFVFPLLPIPGMVFYHHRLMKRYYVKQGDK